MSSVNAAGPTRTERPVKEDRAAAEGSERTSTSDFAALLQATRTSTRTLEEMLQLRASEVGASSRRHSQVVRSLTEAETTEAHKPGDPSLSSRAQRIDRMREESHRASAAPGNTADGPQAQTSADNKPVGRVNDPGDGQITLSDRIEVGRQDVRNQMEPTSRTSRDPMVAAAGAGSHQQPGAGTVGGAAARLQHDLPAGESFRPPVPEINAMNPSMPLRAAANPSNDGNTSAQQQMMQSGVTKNTPATARPINNNSDFQNLLSQLSRQRGVENTPSAKMNGAGRASPETTGPLHLKNMDSVRDLANVVRSQIGPKQSSMTLHLAPEEMGRLRIDVKMQEQGVTVRFEAETQIGHDLLRSRIRELKQTLEQQGIRIDQVEVEMKAAPAPTDSSRDLQNQHQNQNHHQQAEQDPTGEQNEHTGWSQETPDDGREKLGSRTVWSSPVGFEEPVDSQTAPQTISQMTIEEGVDLIL